MPVLDLVTLNITLACVSVASFVVLFSIWRINIHLPGILHWMLGGLLIGLAFLSLFLTEILGWPDSFGSFSSNALSLPAVLFSLEGSLRFRGMNTLLRWRVMLLSMPFLVLMAWVNKDNAVARYLFHDAVSAAGLYAIAFVMIWKTSERNELLANTLAACSALLLAGAFMARWFFALTDQIVADGDIDTPVNQILFFSLILFSMGWTYGLSIACYYRSHQQVMQLAREDALTGLPNRRSIDEMLTRTLADSKRSGEWYALIMIDINNFKQINDDHGHSVGDRFLRAVAQRLLHAVRDADFAGRLGGDEFLVIARGLVNEESIMRIAGRLKAAMNGEVTVEEKNMHVEISIGTAIWPADGTSADKLFSIADTRMYRDKAAMQTTRSAIPA